jgi:hypothetical protein
LSVTVSGCSNNPYETMALAVTAGSAASTAPPLGTITHQYVPTATSPRNGTFCLAVNVTTSNIATVQDGTNVVLKPCVSTDVTQQWAVREGDGTIRLGNGNKCLHPFFQTVDFTMQVTTCAAGQRQIFFLTVSANIDHRKHRPKMDTDTQAPKQRHSWLRVSPFTSARQLDTILALPSSPFRGPAQLTWSYFALVTILVPHSQMTCLYVHTCRPRFHQ